MTKKTRLEVWKKYGCRCAYCGKPVPYEKMQVDHLWPKCLDSETAWVHNGKEHVRVPSDSIENLMPACRQCNHYKRASVLEEYRVLLKTLITRCRKVYINKVAELYGIYQFQEWDGVFFFEKYDPTVDYARVTFETVKVRKETFEEFCKRTFDEQREFERRIGR